MNSTRLYRVSILYWRPRAAPSTCRTFATKECTLKNPRDPLRILFCGSDEFSIYSLVYLKKLQLKSPSIIASIDVVCRPGKRVGRGLKEIRDVPIKAVANELSLPVHEIDTFRGWNPPRPKGEPINLIVAVSFGLFVPPRILKGAKYGGLNVHPSLLPDFRGPAPLHHALLAGDKTFGVTVQTLDLKYFDRGLILAQTPKPGDPIPPTLDQFLPLAAENGANMLTRVIRGRFYESPEKFATPIVEEGSLRHAPKITLHDRHIDWETWTWDVISRRFKTLGSLWNFATAHPPNPKGTDVSPIQKRVRLMKLNLIDPQTIGITTGTSIEPGRPFSWSNSQISKGDVARPLYVFTCQGELIQIEEINVESRKSSAALGSALRGRLIEPLTGPLSKFHETLH
ncbi:hypothetical protein AJ80_00761 [Polytolypa hystricis UAMH7299]|uniref:methionyl-tRNA formyltransferase n=1 Tax=Polytolypa hystricis (strain UAMH7299) TaxID=1447883 RepID=A0A2B7Z291_POLH7|nr:hypothetical protein AJ80_00761 [Polytolypa hystricis UAMH7299]